MIENEKSSYKYGLSSKIKKIFIELHDYFFFHGPSEIKKLDKRFIGRSRIINKLKSILTNNDTRSGAYLVTGYRGMGKSSFVSKVIDEIDPSKRVSIVASRYTRIFALVLLLSLFKLNSKSFISYLLYIILPAITSFASLWYLVYSDRSKEVFKIGSKKSKELTKGLSPISRFLKIFVLYHEVDSESIFRRIVKVVFLTFVIHLTVAAITIFFSEGLEYISRLLTYIFLFFILGIINYLYNLMKDQIKSKQKKIRDILMVTLKKIKNYINYSRRVYIKINLGYDDLKEIDILRLISRNIEKEYKKFKKLTLRNFFTRLFKLVFIYFFVGVIYYYGPIYKLNIELKKNININEYFPSQKKSIIESDSTKTEELIEYLGDGGIIRRVFIYCDTLIYISYQNLKRILPKPLTLKEFLSIKNIDKDFKIFPLNLDYLFLIYFLVFYLIIKYVSPRILNVASDEMIQKKVRELNEMIDFHITEEKGGKAGIKYDFLFNFFRKKIKSQPKADLREIEKRLIEILEMFDHYNRFSLKPEFICIFDELDKIEPHENIHIEEIEEESKSTGQLETTFFATEGVRRRQHTVFKILSNLKHFLNTAKAKFIFIAPREMYDAALADVSDRNFFIGTIFHDVIYVNSFLTDESDKKASDISSMTETYVCQFLFPPFYDVAEFSLKEYKKYLDLFFEKDEDSNNWDEELRQQKISKIIFTLRSFITYLTYRSNGAPKKLTSCFESYIHKPDIEKGETKSKLDCDFCLCVGLNPRNLYLEFSYYDQYTFGMLSYLINPVALAVSKSIKDYGDKLLVSTSFLVDHLYKFHKNAFSWRDIELTPEILDINKAPQLRELISLIINNLSNSHILEIFSGLYNFKFRKKISEEISLLSKISEKEAAAFNFTLDESLSLKRHHRKLLNELRSNYENKKNRPEFLNAISFIHMIVGDLHFYDEEYNAAIIEYMEAIEDLRYMEFSAKNASLLMLLIRNMLKLGYSLEKRKSYVSAFMIYSQLVSYIVKFREINLKELGLKEKQKEHKAMSEFIKKNREKFLVKPDLDRVKQRDKDTPVRILVRDEAFKTSEKFVIHGRKILSEVNRNLNFDEEIELDEFDESNDKPVCLSDDFVELINKTPFSSIKENMIVGISSFEGIRIIYQPLVAKIQMIEKSHLGGLSLIDLKRIENEYLFITKTTKSMEKHLIAAEFWAKIGDILYFKNGLIPKKLYTNMDIPKTDSVENEDFYCSDSDKKSGDKLLCFENSDANRIVEKNGYNIPCRACQYYMRSLKLLCYDHLKITNKYMNKSNLLPTIYFKLKTSLIHSQNATASIILANLVSVIGNSFYSCCTENSVPREGFLKRYLDFIEESSKYFEIFFSKNGKKISTPLSENHLNKVNENPREFNKMEEVFIYYFFSFRFYLNFGQHKGAAGQILKILYVIRNLIRVSDPVKKEVGSMLPEIEKIIVQRGIKNYYRAYGNIHRLEIEDYKNIFNYSLDSNEEVKLKNISLSGNIRELIIIFEEIKLRCGKSEILKNPDQFLIHCPVTPYSSINRMYNRIIELKFKTKINYEIFKKLGFIDILSDLEGKDKDEKIIEERVKKLIYHTGIDLDLIGMAFNFVDIDDIKEKVFLAIEFLITDSIFCLHEIIKLVGLYGITYMVNYSILASAHNRMGNWCDYYFSYFRNSTTDRQKRIKKDLESLIGDDNMQFIGTRFHYEKAREAYFSIFELHSEGKAYENLIEKMYYLNDDFDDATYHFYAAAERHRINTGYIKEEHDKLKKKISDSSIFKYENYL